MKHQVVGCRVAVAVDNVPAGVLSRPEEIVAVVVLECDKRRLNADRHDRTLLAARRTLHEQHQTLAIGY